WTCPVSLKGNKGTGVATLSFAANGTVTWLLTDNAGKVLEDVKGQYSLVNDVLTLVFAADDKTQGGLAWVNNNRFVYNFKGMRLTFDRQRAKEGGDLPQPPATAPSLTGTWVAPLKDKNGKEMALALTLMADGRFGFGAAAGEEVLKKSSGRYTFADGKL